VGRLVRVGVTGSSGLIGRSLVAALEERGDEVVRFLRPTSSASGTSSIRWDPTRGDVDEDHLRRAALDAVVNLAGTGIGDRRWSPARKREILESRVAATSTLVRALASVGVGHLVNASAIGWYGSRGDELLDETSMRGADFLSDVCHAWEDAAAPLADAGTTVTYLRTGIVLDAHGGALRQQLPLFRFGLGGRFGSGDQWMSPVSLADEVRAVLWLLDHRLSGPVNVVAPSPLTNRDFTQVLASALHRPALFTVPHVALGLVLGNEMADELVFASQRVVPSALQSSGFRFEHPDAASALAWALATPK
jgi:uncharacterized protein (TIGR01777 family)